METEEVPLLIQTPMFMGVCAPAVAPARLPALQAAAGEVSVVRAHVTRLLRSLAAVRSALRDTERAIANAGALPAARAAQLQVGSPHGC